MEKPITIVEELPETGENDAIYKVESTQKLYVWNSINNSFEDLIQPTPELPPITGGGVLVVEELPATGSNEVIYKLNSS